MPNGRSISSIFFPILIISLTSILIYSNTFFASFHFDDEFNIVENDRLRDLSNFWPPSGTRYIGFLSFALNYHIHGFNVFGYHLVNLIIHILNGLLVWGFVLLTFKTPAMRPFIADSGQKGFMALLCALIFVAHPVQTQAVTYIVQRFTSLATLFYLFSLVLYVKARLSMPLTVPDLTRRGRDLQIKAWRYYAASVICAILAMKTKEISFTLPLIVVLYEFIFFGSTDSGLTVSNLRRYGMLIPFLATLLIIPLSLISIDKEIGNIIGELRESTQETEEIARISYLLTQFRVIITYLRLLFLPVDQNLDYDYPIYHSWTLPVLLSALFLLLLVVLAVYLMYQSSSKNPGLRLIAFGIFWFFITLSVESSIIPIRDVIAEHRLYLPSVGLIVAVSLTLWAVPHVLRLRWSPFIYHCLVLVIVVIPLGIVAYDRNFTWSDEITLWQDVVKKSPQKARVHLNLGLAYYLDGQLDQATRQYMTAISLKPDYLEAHNNLGTLYADQGRLIEAIEEVGIALKLRPDSPTVHNNLGYIYYRQRRLDEAVKEVGLALSLKPDFPEAHNNLGNIHLQRKMIDQAIERYIAAINLKPDYAEAHNNLGTAYVHVGRLDEAVKEVGLALSLKPDFPEAHNNLGNIYYRQRRLDEAIQEYMAAIRLRPDSVTARYNLANVFKLKGLTHEARVQFEMVLALQPDFIAARHAIESLESNPQSPSTLPHQ